MNAILLDFLRAHYGTVSSQTPNSGVVAVRNKTALKVLTVALDGRATVTPKTGSGRFPQLVTVTELPNVDIE